MGRAFNTRHRMKEYYIRQSVVLYMKVKVEKSRNAEGYNRVFF